MRNRGLRWGVVTAYRGGDNLIAYALTPSAEVIVENSIFILTIETTGIPDSTLLYWTIDNLGTITTGDFWYMRVNGSDIATSLSGSVMITGNSASIQMDVILDAVSEPTGTEKFTMSLRTDSVSGSVVAVTPIITIDTVRATITYPQVPMDSVRVGNTLYVVNIHITNPLQSIDLVAFTPSVAVTHPTEITNGIASITSDGTYLYMTDYRHLGKVYKTLLDGTLVTSWVVPIASPTTREITVRYYVDPILGGKLFVGADNSGGNQLFRYSLTGTLEASGTALGIGRVFNCIVASANYYYNYDSSSFIRFGADLVLDYEKLMISPERIFGSNRAIASDGTYLYSLMDTGANTDVYLNKYNEDGDLLATYDISADIAGLQFYGRFLLYIGGNKLLIIGVAGITRAAKIITTSGAELKAYKTIDNNAIYAAEAYLNGFAYAKESSNIQRLPLI